MTGNGIASIRKTSTVGLVDTYTITYTNGNTTTFTVTNGEVTREELEEEVDRLSMIYNAFPTTTGEGEEPSINGTAEVPFKEIGLKGNTSQETTTGKNLCNLNVAQNSRVTINSDGTITINGNGGFTLNISKYNFKANTTYYMKWELVSGSVSFWQVFMSPVGNKWSEKDKFTSFTVDSDTESSGIWVHNNSVFTNAVIRIWFSETQSPFEPYTGGNPAPNPDYPYPVNVVTGDNEVIVSNGDNTQSQTYPINLDSMELCKIGNYQDRIYKDNGKWYLEKQIGKIVLDGTTAPNNSDTSFTNTTRAGWWGILSQSSVGYTTQLPISNYFVGKTMWMTDSEGIYTTGSDIVLRGNKTSIGTTTAEIQTWLSTHNTIIYYVLKTPTITEITDTTLIEQLDNLEKAYSYDTQTNISQTNQDKPFIISYEAILSLKNVLND